jgi:hypothetical protein
MGVNCLVYVVLGTKRLVAKSTCINECAPVPVITLVTAIFNTPVVPSGDSPECSWGEASRVGPPSVMG